MGVPERGAWKFRVPSFASAFGRAHGSSEFRVSLQPSAGRIGPPAHPRSGGFAAKSVNLPLMGCHAVTDGMIDVSLHFRLKSSFCSKHKSSPLPLRGIPLIKGGLTELPLRGFSFGPKGVKNGGLMENRELPGVPLKIQRLQIIKKAPKGSRVHNPHCFRGFFQCRRVSFSFFHGTMCERGFSPSPPSLRMATAGTCR